MPLLLRRPLSLAVTTTRITPPAFFALLPSARLVGVSGDEGLREMERVEGFGELGLRSGYQLSCRRPPSLTPAAVAVHGVLGRWRTEKGSGDKR